MEQKKGFSLITFFVGFLVLIVVIISVLILMLVDNNVSEPEYLKDSQPVDFDINNLVSKGLEDTKNSQKIDIAIDEKDLSIILKSTMLKLNPSLNSSGINIVTSYIDVDANNEMLFKTHFSAFGLMTSVTGKFSYSFDNDVLTMSLDKMSLGKFSSNASIISNFISEDEFNTMVNKELADTGVKFTLNGNSLLVTLSLTSVKDMLLDTLSSSGDNSLYQTLVSLIFRIDNMITLTDSADKLGISIDVNSLCFDNNRDTAIPYNIDFDNISDKVEQLLNNNIITMDDASAVATYLVKGYDKLDGEDRSKVDSIDFSSLGITNSAEYVGVLEYDETEVKDIFVSQIPTDLSALQNFIGFSLKENDFNNTLLQTKLVGGMYCFARQEEDGYKVSYIAIESIYVDLIDNHFAVYLTMSLNGQSIVLNIEIDAKEATGLKVDGQIESIRLGSEILSSSETETLLSYLEDMINTEWIIVDSSNCSINIDFTSMFGNSAELNSLITQLALINPDKALKTQFVDGEIIISYR